PWAGPPPPRYLVTRPATRSFLRIPSSSAARSSRLAAGAGRRTKSALSGGGFLGISEGYLEISSAQPANTQGQQRQHDPERGGPAPPDIAAEPAAVGQQPGLLRLDGHRHRRLHGPVQPLRREHVAGGLERADLAHGRGGHRV